ncbi:MAG: hypothetical protein MUC35_02005 [Candidatus Margulisbacteria bacterium]|jgi:hypothetical protein|nr:hypothetical protein [Candidatus Margulisiibacteriota bacterium]
MKKYLLASLLFVLAVATLTGCGSSTSSSSTTTSAVPPASIAGSVGVASKDLLAIDNSILGVVTSAGIKAAAVSDLAYSGGWWSGTNDYSSSYEGVVYGYVYTYNFRVWDAGGNELTTLASLRGVGDDAVAGISRIWTYTTLNTTIGSASYSSTYGNSKDDPLKFDGVGASGSTVTGTVKFAGSYSTTSYTMTFTYSSLGMTASGYPNGSITFTMTEGGATTATGSITYNGTRYCTIAITTGGTSYSYTCDLTDGSVTAAAL